MSYIQTHCRTDMFCDITPTCLIVAREVVFEQSGRSEFTYHADNPRKHSGHVRYDNTPKPETDHILKLTLVLCIQYTVARKIQASRRLQSNALTDSLSLPRTWLHSFVSPRVEGGHSLDSYMMSPISPAGGLLNRGDYTVRLCFILSLYMKSTYDIVA